MLHPSTKRLIDKLSDMTRRQRVAWTEGENDSVVHDTEGYRVVLTAAPHGVLLTDGTGREIETCTPEEIAGEEDMQGQPYPVYVAQLYREAHRYARGAEKAISTVLAGLDAVEPDAPFVERRRPVVEPVIETIGPLDAITDETAPIESETAITAAVASLAEQVNSQENAAEATPVAETAITPEPAPEALAEPEPAGLLLGDALDLDAMPEVPAENVDLPAVSAKPEVAVEEPGSFGTFGAFEPAASAHVEQPALPEQPLFQPAIEPAPAPQPEPVLTVPDVSPPPPTFTPTLSKPISLSSIPFGFGLGAAQREGAPSHPAITPPEPPPAALSDTPNPQVIDGTVDLPDSGLAAFEETVATDPYVGTSPEPEIEDLPKEEPDPAIEPGQPRRFNPWN
jgi:hypothetical protein